METTFNNGNHNGSPKLSGEQNCRTGNKKVENPITISHDWIEFTGDMQSFINEVHSNIFIHREMDSGTQQFKRLFKIFTTIQDEELEFCNLELEPRPSFLSPRLVRVKIHNRFCYTYNVSKFISLFLHAYKIKFKHYTRIDYAIDFQHVKMYGRDIQKMMYAFASKKLYVKSKSFKTHSLVSSYTGLTWGSRTSGLSIVLYNKTFEMVKKGVKPWISDLWKRASFDDNVDVYRLEFSTKNPRIDIVEVETAEYLGSYSEIDFLAKYIEHVVFLYQHYFQTAYYKKGIRFSRCRRFIPLDLNTPETIFTPVVPCIKPKSNNINKTVIKNLVLEAAFLQKSGKRIEASNAWNLAMNLVERYSLQKWWSIYFERLGVKSSYMTHADVAKLEEIKNIKLKEATWKF